MSRSLLAALAALLLAALALALWLARPSARGGRSPDAVGREDVGPRAREVASAEPRPAGVGEGEREPVTSAPELAADAPTRRERSEPCAFHGVALDGLDGQPIAGARALVVRGGSSSPAERIAEEDVALEARSDALGRFRLDLPARHAGHAQLVAEGYGSRSFVYDGEHDAPERALAVELLPSAALEIVVRDPDGRTLQSAGVELVARHESSLRGVARFAGGQASTTQYKLTDGEGAAVFERLPAEVELALSVRAPRGPSARELSFALAPGERRRLEFVLGGTARVHGRATDERGEPVVGQELVLFSAARGAGIEARNRFATTSADGAFEFVEVGYGAYLLSSNEGDSAFALERVEVDVEGPDVLRDLSLVRGLRISGRVVAEGGELVEGAVASVLRPDGTLAWSGPVEEDSFRTVPLAPGEYRVEVTDARLSGAVRALAGADVEVRVGPTREVLLRVPGADECDAVVLDLARGTLAGLGDASAARFLLREGEYSLRVETPDGRVALLPRFVVSADEPAGELVLEPVPGARLTVVHRATDAARSLRLSARGEPVPLPRQASALVPGAATSVLVPAGAITAELLERGAVVASESVLLAPGERRRIVLDPR